MMKAFLVLSLFALLSVNVQSQEQFFSRNALEADIDYLRQQIRDVHADPLRELDQVKWDSLFTSMRKQINDSMNKPAFFSLIRPAFAFLSDEHADISAPDYFNSNAVFPPFSLQRSGEVFLIDTVLGSLPLGKGMRVVAVNNIPVAKILDELAFYTTGFEDERKQKTAEQFGYLYGFAHPYEKEWTVTLQDQSIVRISGASHAQWTGRLKKLYGVGTGKKEMSYQTFGKTGYLTIPAFAVRNDADAQAYSRTIDSVFTIATRDHADKLVIDISQNSGGNSIVGTMLINHFYSKPYLTYQMKWRRSKEYLALIKSWGNEDAAYEALAPGATLHRNASTVTPDGETQKFSGKIYVVIGNGTFSSAIMFATIVKDNKLATLIGQSPRLGHPTHFGEQYNSKLPNTQLSFRFGVKEWIRPLGNKVRNILEPDIFLPEVNAAAVLKEIEK